MVDVVGWSLFWGQPDTAIHIEGFIITNLFFLGCNKLLWIGFIVTIMEFI